MIGSGSLLVAGASAVLAARLASSSAAARGTTAGWPVHRCGRAVIALAAYDVAVTAVSFVGLAWLPTRSAGALGADTAASWVAVVGSVLAGLAAAAILRWRPGRWSWLWSSSLARPEDPLGRRGRLLLDVERHAARAVSRWIMQRSDDCRRQAGVTADQLLPAAWPAVRLLLRETDDRERMGLALVLSQAQAVMDDGSPAQERLLTLLQMVHDRTGPGGVRRVLDQAVRAPVRHGRAGAPAWGLGPAALPGRGVPTVSLPGSAPAASVQLPVDDRA